MKKGKVLGKSQITVALMVVALGTAIWLNSKYLPSDTKYLGEASYVSNSSGEEAVATNADASESEADYFTSSKKEREKAREEAIELIENTLDNDNLKEADKKSALEKAEAIAQHMEQESNIETLLKGKGFDKAVAVISDNSISIVVKADGLTSQQTLQIQDIVTDETSIALSDIKIIPVK